MQNGKIFLKAFRFKLLFISDWGNLCETWLIKSQRDMRDFKTLKDTSYKAIVWHDNGSCVFSKKSLHVAFFFKNGVLYPFVRLRPVRSIGVSRGRIELKKI